MRGRLSAIPASAARLVVYAGQQMCGPCSSGGGAGWREGAGVMGLGVSGSSLWHPSGVRLFAGTTTEAEHSSWRNSVHFMSPEAGVLLDVTCGRYERVDLSSFTIEFWWSFLCLESFVGVYFGLAKWI